MSEIVCRMRLRRVGETVYEDIETQHRARPPFFGDVVEVSVGNKPTLGRVAYVTSPPAGAATDTYYVHVDEIGIWGRPPLSHSKMRRHA